MYIALKSCITFNVYSHIQREDSDFSQEPIFLQSVLAYRHLPVLYTNNVIEQHSHFIANTTAHNITTVRIKDQRWP